MARTPLVLLIVVVLVPWSRESVSPRRRRLPSDWVARRRAVLKRDGGVCQWRLDSGTVCGRPASDVDHVVRNDDDSFGNLRALCSEHHGRKTAREGAAEYWRLVGESRARFRREDKHPGLVG